MTTNTQSAAVVPSGRNLAKATLLALLAGSAVLVTAVLPAEFGLDPLGTGRVLGLLDLYASQSATAAPATVTPAPEGPVFTQVAALKDDSRDFTLGAYGTMEFKYHLDEGAAMLYDWKATEELSFDFHTERAGSGASETFEKGQASWKRGAYVAPYAGIHGWYWKNNTDHDVKITLASTGFYPSAKLFLDGGAGQEVPLIGAAP